MLAWWCAVWMAHSGMVWCMLGWCCMVCMVHGGMVWLMLAWWHVYGVYGGMVWCTLGWCAANDYLSIAQFESVIGRHPTILLVNWSSWYWILHLWKTELHFETLWEINGTSTFSSHKFLKNFCSKMRLTKFYHKTAATFYPRSNSSRQVGRGNIMHQKLLTWPAPKRLSKFKLAKLGNMAI